MNLNTFTLPNMSLLNSLNEIMMLFLSSHRGREFQQRHGNSLPMSNANAEKRKTGGHFSDFLYVSRLFLSTEGAFVEYME